MTEPTPRPWRLDPKIEGHVFSGRRLIAGCMGHANNEVDVRGQNLANAELIVAAVNSHDALVKACRAIRGLGCVPPGQPEFRLLEDALALVEEKS